MEDLKSYSGEGPAKDFDVLITNEDPSDSNILKGLERLQKKYSDYCDTREKIADQGVDIPRTDSFFTNKRSVQVAKFKITVTDSNQLDRLIGLYRKKVGSEPVGVPFNGPVNGPEDLPEHIAC